MPTINVFIISFLSWYVILMGVLWASNFNYQMNTWLKKMHNYYTIAHSLHHPGQLLYFNTPVLTSLNIETAGKIFLCFMWNVSVLPGGYAGDLLQWLPQSEPADGFSPMKKTQQARFKMHSGLWLVFSSEFHLMPWKGSFFSSCEIMTHFM